MVSMVWIVYMPVLFIVFTDENFKRQILRQLNILSIKIDQISQDISNLNLIRDRQDPVQQESIMDQFQLPLRTEEDLNLFEDFLQNKENVCKVVSIFPSCIRYNSKFFNWMRLHIRLYYHIPTKFPVVHFNKWIIPQ